MPAAVPGADSRVVSWARASPKSASLALPPQSMMLWGLTSRWMTPLAWRLASPAATSASIGTRTSGGRRPAAPSSASASEPPSHSSMTKNGSRPVDRVAAIDVVDGHDARVRGGRQRPRLAVEAAGDERVAGEVRQQDLDGHVALQPKVPGAIHDGRGARAEGRVDPVSPGQRVPDHRHAGERSGCARIGTSGQTVASPTPVGLPPTAIRLVGNPARSSPDHPLGAVPMELQCSPRLRAGIRAARCPTSPAPGSTTPCVTWRRGTASRGTGTTWSGKSCPERRAWSGRDGRSAGTTRSADRQSHLQGFEIGDAAPYFATPGTYRRPRAIHEPRWDGAIYVGEWQVRGRGHRPAIVKQTIVGPYTLARLSDSGPLTRERLTMALADALSHELRRLEAEGCPLIQIDESAAADDRRQPERSRSCSRRPTAA